MPGQPNLLEDVANDLALWIDQTATQVALAFAPARAPFSAQVTEEQKLEFYRTRLFNPDGTPNPQGRQAEMQRLGSEGFANVYKAVIKRYPELRVAPPPPIEVPSEWPQAAPAGPPAGPPGPPGAPPGPPAGLPPGPGGTGGPLPGPLGAGPPRPPMMPPPGVRPMASGGVVTQPTLALIGEAGPEAVVPLADYQYQQPNYFAGTPGPAYVPPIANYSEQVQPHWGVEGVTGGTDMWAPVGTPIQAMRGGQVIESGYDPTGGNAVLVQGDDGRSYYYAHMQQAPLVKVGDTIPTGAQLGGLGDTGVAKGKPHLHLGVGEQIQTGSDVHGGIGTNYDVVSQLRDLYGQSGR